jgi:diguanylate cyclase (GGDEF)-like protein
MLSRELLQSDDAIGSLELVGKTLVEMMRMDSALLIVRTEGTEYIVGVDSAGMARQADANHPLYRPGRSCLSGADAPGAAGESEPHGSTLAAGVPAEAPVAALVVDWDRKVERDTLHGRERLLPYIAELAVAALGKVQTRCALESLAPGQYEQVSDTPQAHAAELARRDMAENGMGFLSLTDVLTGLRNRRGFFLFAEHTFRVAQRQHAKSAVIYADVDDLRRVNEELGHDGGDRLIRDAARIFRESFRGADVVARVGGDEFVAFTLDDEHPDAVLERIHKNLHAFNLMEERPYQVSFSTGIVQCDPAGDQTLSDYLLLADQQMYTHKRRRLH